jgi:hypothetical protein
MQIMVRLARYCEARQQACDMINEAREKAAQYAVEDEAAREDEIHVTKETICTMLESCALTKRDFICLGVIGITLDGWDSKEEVLQTTITKILKGIYECRAGDAPLQLVQSLPFQDATDFEASRLLEASLGGPSEVLGTNTPSSAHIAQIPISIFGPSRCYICCKVFTSFTLRRCLRKKFCRSCGNACCVACCSHKVFDVESDCGEDICVHCVLVRSKQASGASTSIY